MMRLLSLAVLVLIAACAAPAPVLVPEPIPEPPAGPEFGALLLSGGQLLVQEEASRAIGPDGVRRVDTVFPGGADGAVMFSVSTQDSTHLFRAHRGNVASVHAVAGTAVYTVAWSPDGEQAAFGHYRPSGEASPGRPNMGAGNILVFDGSTASSVGCSASRAVLGWAPDGRLLVRNTDNLYVIERDGCDTVSTIDARRMHRLTVSPDVSHLVFVHRELEYDRTTRAYVADSTFRMTDLAGEDPRTVVSFRYRPEGFAWRADGMELAFDVIDPNLPGARAISIFDLATGRASYLHPPTSAESREFAPAWSPSGARIAYKQGSGSSASIAVRSFADQFPVVIPDSDGAQLVGWFDDHALVMRDSGGTTTIVSLQGAEAGRIDGADAVIDVWRIR